MKRFPFYVLLLFLTACAAPSILASKAPAEAALAQDAKLLAITAEAETQTSEYPANGATMTAIVADKYLGGNAMAATMAAQPSETPIPTIPPNSPLCRPTDLKTDASSGSPATGGQFLFGASLTNIGNTPCFLQAWPQVMLLDQKGRPLDVDYHYFDVSAGDAVAAATRQAQESAIAKVGLWPGWSVSLDLVWSNWCGAALPDGVVMRLTLIDNLGIIDIPTNVQAACDAPGFRSSVGISKLSPAMPPQ